MPFVVGLKELRGRRYKLFLSQAAFARLAKLDRQTIARCDNGYSILQGSCDRIVVALEEAGVPQAAIVVDPIGKPGLIPRSKGKARGKASPKPRQKRS